MLLLPRLELFDRFDRLALLRFDELFDRLALLRFDELRDWLALLRFDERLDRLAWLERCDCERWLAWLRDELDELRWTALDRLLPALERELACPRLDDALLREVVARLRELDAVDGRE